MHNRQATSLRLDMDTETDIVGQTYQNKVGADLISAPGAQGHTTYLKLDGAKSTIDSMINNATRQYDRNEMDGDQLRAYVPALSDSQLQDIRSAMHSAIDPHVAKVDNQWVEIPHTVKGKIRS